jgi:DNA-binding LytR/AlgR family response regulator
MNPTISVLIADDEPPALDELEYLLGADARVATILRASSGAEVVRMLALEPVDAVFLDIHMPGLSGFDLARALSRFERRPAVVFVTADEEGALEAFDLAAVDYLLKPVRAERLERSVTRVLEAGQPAPTTGPIARPETVAVTLGGTTRMIRRDEIRFVQAQGDYARLHTDDGSYLTRIPIRDLEVRWATAGFIRVHRSYLVAIAHITRLRLGTSRPTVTAGGVDLPVSRRLLPALRDALESSRVRPLS